MSAQLGPMYARMVIHSCELTFFITTDDPKKTKRNLRLCLNRLGYTRDKIVVSLSGDRVVVFKKEEYNVLNPQLYPYHNL